MRRKVADRSGVFGHQALTVAVVEIKADGRVE